MAEKLLNPHQFLQDLVGKDIVARLKWNNTEYHGRLISIDSYMNLQVREAQEIIDGTSRGALGEILIRCNNVLWISAKDADKKNGEAA